MLLGEEIAISVHKRCWIKEIFRYENRITLINLCPISYGRGLE
jgi:hypothetical protein